MNWQPRIRTILLIVNILILTVTLGGVNLLRIFETTLLRQTETELNTQATFIAALYKELYAQKLGEGIDAPLRVSEDEVTWTPLHSTINLDTTPMVEEEPKPGPYTGPAIIEAERQVGQALVRILQDAQRHTLASIRVVNHDGVIISSTNLMHDNILLTLTNRPEVVAALNGEHQVILRKRALTHETPNAFSISRSAGFRIHVAHPITYNTKNIGAVVLSRTPQSIYQLMGRHKIEIASYIGFAILLVWLIATFTSLTIRKPIIAVMKQAERAKRGEKGAVTPLKYPGSHEVMELSSSVADMAITLEKRADYIMEILSHVSHEFKTPVTAIQGAVELLIDHNDTMSNEQRHRFLHNLQQDGQRIENLVYRVLDLAKADVKRVSGETIQANKSLDQIIQSYIHKGISVEREPRSKDSNKDDQVSISIDQESFDSVLGNLFDNAIQAKASCITVSTEVVSRSDSRFYSIRVQDNGEDISESNAEKMFEPFFTTHRKTGGTGLGLSILKSLLTSQGGDIEFCYSTPERVKTFIVTIPTI